MAAVILIELTLIMEYIENIILFNRQHAIMMLSFKYTTIYKAESDLSQPIIMATHLLGKFAFQITGFGI